MIAVVVVGLNVDRLVKAAVETEATKSLGLNPKLTIEQAHGVLNFRKAEQMMPRSEPSKKPMMLVIDKLEVRNADVVILPGLPGLSQQVNVHVPSVMLKDVGRGKGAQNGAAIREVAMQVIGALAERAAQSPGIPAPLKALLHLNVGATAASMGNDTVKRIGEAVPGQLGNDLLNEFGGLGGSQPTGRAPSPRPRGQ